MRTKYLFFVVLSLACSLASAANKKDDKYEHVKVQPSNCPDVVAVLGLKKLQLDELSHDRHFDPVTPYLAILAPLAETKEALDKMEAEVRENKVSEADYRAAVAKFEKDLQTFVGRNAGTTQHIGLTKGTATYAIFKETLFLLQLQKALQMMVIQMIKNCLLDIPLDVAQDENRVFLAVEEARWKSRLETGLTKADVFFKAIIDLPMPAKLTTVDQLHRGIVFDSMRSEAEQKVPAVFSNFVRAYVDLVTQGIRGNQVVLHSDEVLVDLLGYLAVAKKLYGFDAVPPGTAPPKPPEPPGPKNLVH